MLTDSFNKLTYGTVDTCPPIGTDTIVGAIRVHTGSIISTGVGHVYRTALTNSPMVQLTPVHPLVQTQ